MIATFTKRWNVDLLTVAHGLGPVTHWMRRASVSAAWRVRLYFGSHVNRLDLTHCLRDACMLEIEPTRVGSVSRQNRIGKYVCMSFRREYILINDMLMFESL